MIKTHPRRDEYQTLLYFSLAEKSMPNSTTPGQSDKF